MTKYYDVPIKKILDDSGLVLLDASFYGGRCIVGNFSRKLFNVQTLEELGKLNDEMSELDEFFSWNLKNVVSEEGVYSVQGSSNELEVFRDILKKKNKSFLRKYGSSGYLDILWRNLDVLIGSLRDHDGRREPIHRRREHIKPVDYELFEHALGYVLDLKDKVSVLSGDRDFFEIVSDIVTSTHKKYFNLLEDKLVVYIPDRFGSHLFRKMDVHECADYFAGTTDSLKYLSVAN